MTEKPSLRERQAPLKARYEADPDSAKLTFTIESRTAGHDDPTRVRVGTAGAPGVEWAVAAHPFAGGEGDLACSGDLLLASLAACQEITVRMVAAAMGIAIDELAVTVEGDMDFRGTMGIDPDAPVGFSAIRTKVRIAADVAPDRLARLAQRAEKYCVVASTLRHSPEMTLEFEAAPAAGGSSQA
ncbi:MAG: OsmC family protein [Thermomicrobiales bacterium]